MSARAAKKPDAVPALTDPAKLRGAYHDEAAGYREVHDHLSATGGFVIFWHRRPCGWTADIAAKPDHWDPGCIAVPADPAGPCYAARGGDYINGAARWEPVAIAQLP